MKKIMVKKYGWRDYLGSSGCRASVFRNYYALLTNAKYMHLRFVEPYGYFHSLDYPFAFYLTA
ncbi:TPA: hypothetical protein ACGE8L_004708 [Yersinia enterocolitica]|nr:hypothetical protein [Yersinia enterocolitica]HEK7317260.1 hypothetical protein [Yersinia enterocolitica]HEN3294867.1 hypothetical protein [Yersinia enterocolitica]